MEYLMKNISWSEFDERRKDVKTIIIPAGATEVYGPHLPMGSDIIVAQRVSELIAKEVNGLVAPCLEVGQSKSLTSFPGTIAISAATLSAVYREIIQECIRLGFKNYVLINAHKHNSQPLNEVLEDLRLSHGIKYMQIDWWQYMPIVAKDVYEYKTPFTHAGESGTSTMLYLAKEYVHMERAITVEPMYKEKWPGIAKSVDFAEYTTTGTWGAGSLGTEEKGKKAVENAIREIVDCIHNYLEK